MLHFFSKRFNLVPLKSKYLSIAQLAHLYMSIGKTIALTIQTFVSKVVSLLFNSLSRFVTAFTFKLWYWRRLLRVPWTARSNQSILKEINPEYSFKGLIWSWNSNILATWCKELTHGKRCWCWARLKAGGELGDRGWDGWMASLTQWTWVWANSGR